MSVTGAHRAGGTFGDYGRLRNRPKVTSACGDSQQLPAATWESHPKSGDLTHLCCLFSYIKQFEIVSYVLLGKKKKKKDL